MGLIADLRSLALMRIALAGVLIADMAIRLRDLGAFYTDAGVLPRSTYLLFASPWTPSLHMMSGLYGFELALFALTFLALFALLLGYRTRLASVAAWVLVYSCHMRNDFLLYGADHLARALLFWSMFIPLGARFSLDAARGARPPDPRHLSPGSLALFGQLTLMYFVTGLMKSDPVWWSEGSALYYTLNIDAFVSPLGRRLLYYPALLRALGWLTIALELGGSLAILFLRGGARFALLATFVLFHVGLFFTLELGAFSFVCIAGWLAFLPARFWEWRAGRALEARLESLFARLARPFPAGAAFREPRGLRARIAGVAVAVCFLGTLIFNFAQIDNMRVRVGPLMGAFVRSLALDQRWNMFAPFPMRDDGWFVFEGELRDGARRDVFRDAELSFDKPADAAHAHRDYLWYTYLHTLWNLREDEAYRALGRYLCREWNERHTGDARLDTLRVYYLLEYTPPPGEPIRLPERKMLWEHHCFGAPPAEE